VQPGSGEDGGRSQREDEQQDADAHEVLFAERDGGDQAGQTGGEQRASADGETAE
jgi:hypothetical protein